ncbi:MAG: PilZ domain-containing protein [candidate division NC10 bacterium]|nr:PilZ domain-containing protein [candidate division NC10 bacterium]
MEGQVANRPQENLGRRRFVRLPVVVPVVGRAVQFPGEEIQGMVRNIAAGGVLVEFPVQMVPGSVVDLVLQTRGGPREMEGKVVWTSAVEGKIHHGIAFPEPKEQTFALELFLHENR